MVNILHFLLFLYVFGSPTTFHIEVGISILCFFVMLMYILILRSAGVGGSSVALTTSLIAKYSTKSAMI